jgi:hypothetical protein
MRGLRDTAAGIALIVMQLLYFAAAVSLILYPSPIR